MPATASATTAAAQRPAARRAAQPLCPRPPLAAEAAVPLGGAARPPPPTVAGGLPATLRHELAVILADVAWGLYRKEEHSDDLNHGAVGAQGEP